MTARDETDNTPVDHNYYLSFGYFDPLLGKRIIKGLSRDRCGSLRATLVSSMWEALIQSIPFHGEIPIQGQPGTTVSSFSSTEAMKKKREGSSSRCECVI